jgi:excinuclease ABC subunit C
MKMCLAPCFKGCTDTEYAAEVSRVQAYFDSGGESLVREFSSDRDRASNHLDFENAAILHARLEKINPVLNQCPEAVHRLDLLSALMVQPSHLGERVTFFHLNGGYLSGPRTFSIQPNEHTKSRSMESRVLEAVQSFTEPRRAPALEIMEHLALFKRWFYRGTRMGEIFFADHKGELPMRRVVRGISRVYRGEKPSEESNSIAQES